MAVEKLIMMNIVGKNTYVDKVIRDILLFENVQILDAYNEIESFRFSMNITDENIDEIVGFSEAESGQKFSNAEDFVNKLGILEEIFGPEYKINKNLLKEEIDLPSVIESVNKIYGETHEKHGKLKEYNDQIAEIDKSILAYRFLSPMNIKMEDVNALQNFNYTIGTFSKKNMTRLKNNYSNITALVVHVGSIDENEVYVVISPDYLDTETNRILKSLNFNPIEGIHKDYIGNPSAIVSMLESSKSQLQEKTKSLENEVSEIKEKFKEESNYAYNVLRLYKRIQEVKKDMAFSTELFYFSGWIPVRLKAEIKSLLSKYQDIIILFQDEDTNSNTKPPTKLKNNWLFKPFEFFIKMYGVPNYNELDPTPFLSITYLVLFGFMFGDLGQGFVFFLVGLLMRAKGMQLGSIISRLGLSSMFFGFLYGSLFGFETIIPSLWIKPFENTNTILLTAIAIGVFMITIGYIYGIINQFKSKDYYNTVLSHNGITGLVLYFSFILIVLAIMTGNRIISIGVLGVIIAITIIILFLKEPIIDKLSKRSKQDSHTLNGNFFVESFFEVFEVLLSIFSNTLSFIRVGAFALNHVGLFIAFETLAHMVNSGVGSTFVFILGNIFIMVLEGLIVGIQVLRLEYYELFSKYFVGGGEEFTPAKL